MIDFIYNVWEKTETPYYYRNWIKIVLFPLRIIITILSPIILLFMVIFSLFYLLFKKIFNRIKFLFIKEKLRKNK
jgi:hypothetical protein